MSAYDDDPRVEQNNAAHYWVGDYTVATNDYASWWIVGPNETLTTRSVREPFLTADEAIRSLIGEPQTTS